MSTGIEWTDETWNPVTGCTKVSLGCDHCYAESIAHRFAGTRAFPNGFTVTLHPEHVEQPLRWRKPRRVFVNSMADLFHAEVPDEFIARVFAVMALTPQHTYQVLTKRHGRMRSLLRNECTCGSGHAPSVHFRSQMAWEVSQANPNRIPGVPDDAEHRVFFETAWPLRNVWLGVSVEDQKRADLRIPALLDTPATVRFLSCEPLLGPVDLSAWMPAGCRRFYSGKAQETCPDCGRVGYWCGSHVGNGHPNGQPIDWVIVGGESGPKARPMHPAWARSLRDQCSSTQVPFFFKQWGEWAPAPWRVDRQPDETIESYQARAEATCATHAYPVWADKYGHEPHRPVHKPWSCERTSLSSTEYAAIRRVGKKTAGRVLDGRTWDEYPHEFQNR